MENLSHQLKKEKILTPEILKRMGLSAVLAFGSGCTQTITSVEKITSKKVRVEGTPFPGIAEFGERTRDNIETDELETGLSFMRKNGGEMVVFRFATLIDNRPDRLDIRIPDPEDIELEDNDYVEIWTAHTHPPEVARAFLGRINVDPKLLEEYSFRVIPPSAPDIISMCDMGNMNTQQVNYGSVVYDATGYWQMSVHNPERVESCATETLALHKKILENPNYLKQIDQEGDLSVDYVDITKKQLSVMLLPDDEKQAAIHDMQKHLLEKYGIKLFRHEYE